MPSSDGNSNLGHYTKFLYLDSNSTNVGFNIYGLFNGNAITLDTLLTSFSVLKVKFYI